MSLENKIQPHWHCLVKEDEIERRYVLSVTETDVYIAGNFIGHLNPFDDRALIVPFSTDMVEYQRVWETAHSIYRNNSENERVLHIYRPKFDFISEEDEQKLIGYLRQ